MMDDILLLATINANIQYIVTPKFQKLVLGPEDNNDFSVVMEKGKSVY
jgi:hypothetical protein